ncbi:MAG: isoprenylcysteine carboxylmethyltransferase family protein [Pseudomonadota bacterium]
MTLETTLAYALLAVVAGARLAELALARRNTRRLRAAGGIEVGAAHYPLFILLHGAWLTSLVLSVGPTTRIDPWLVALFGLLQIGRVWIIRTLGRFWTTRIITVPGAPLICTGPYRFLRHPNYLLVSAEIAVLPLAVGAIWQALLFSVLNGLLLLYRMRVEAAALAPRQAIERGNRSCAAQPFRP